MYEALTQRFPDSSHYVQGWGLSLLIHGLAVGVAALMLGDLKLAPQPEPFKWNVAMVEPPPVVQPADSRPKPAQPAKRAPAPKPEEPRPVERQTTSVQAVPTPQPTPTPVIQRQEPIRPMVEKKPEPEVKPETKPVPKDVKPDVLPPMPVAAKPETKPVLKDVKPDVLPPMPVAAKPVEPVEPPVQHPTHTISTQSAESSASLEKPFIEQASTHAEPAPAHPVLPAPLVASVTPSVPTPPIPAHPAAREPAAELPAPTSAAPIQEASATASPTPSGAGRHKAKADFGWVGKALWDRVMNLKRYPHMARARHLEGRVVVRVVIREGGQLAKVDVAESSGHEILDLDAVEVLRRAFPLKFDHPLEQPEVVVQIPIIYKLQ